MQHAGAADSWRRLSVRAWGLGVMTDARALPGFGIFAIGG